MENGRNTPADIELQVLKEVSLHPVTLYSVSLGLGSVIFGLLTLSVLPFLAMWMTVLGIFSAVGGVVNWMINYFFRYDTIVNSCLKQYARSAEEQRRQEIQMLRQKLAADGDPRTEKLLDDLLILTSVFQNVKHWKIDSYSQYEIARKVNALFEEGIKNLEQTLHLWYTAHSLNTGTIRNAIVQQREELIQDLTDGINQLGSIIGNLQELSLDDRSQPLSGIVQELDATMAIARRVQERMRSYDVDGKITA